MAIGRVVVPDELEIGHLRDGKPARHVADQLDPVRAEVEQVGGEQASRHEHERAGHRRRQATQTEDHRERGDADEQRRRLHVTERAQPRRELAPRVVTLGGRAGELRQLPDDHVDGGSRQEARDHRLRQEAGDPSHPQEREQQEQQPGRERDRRDQLRRLLAGQAGHDHRASRHGRERRARPRRDVPRGAEERVDDAAGGGRVQPVLQRHPGDARVPEVLRHDQGRDRDPGGDVAAQPPTLVARQPVGPPAARGRDPAPGGHALTHRARRRCAPSAGAGLSR